MNPDKFPGALDTQAEVLALVGKHAVSVGLLDSPTDLETVPAPDLVLPKDIR
jgi:hypothetical protein